MQGAHGPKPGVLNGVFGIGARAQHALRVGNARGMVRIDECGEVGISWKTWSCWAIRLGHCQCCYRQSLDKVTRGVTGDVGRVGA